VIDAEVRIALVGIDVITVNAVVKVASFETWDRHIGAPILDAEDRPPARMERDIRGAVTARPGVGWWWRLPPVRPARTALRSAARAKTPSRATRKRSA
jgi:hypothetical protein